MRKIFFILLTFLFTAFSYGVLPEFFSYRFPSDSFFVAQTAEEAQALVDKGVDVNEHINTHTPLYFAIEQDRVEVVRVLLENGADLNDTGHLRHGISYLHMVRSEKMAKLLIEHGADVHRRGNIGKNGNGVLSAVWDNLYYEYIKPEPGRSPYREASKIRKVFKEAGAGFVNRMKGKCATAFSFSQ